MVHRKSTITLGVTYEYDTTSLVALRDKVREGVDKLSKEDYPYNFVIDGSVYDRISLYVVPKDSYDPLLIVDAYPVNDDIVFKVRNKAKGSLGLSADKIEILKDIITYSCHSLPRDYYNWNHDTYLFNERLKASAHSIFGGLSNRILSYDLKIK